MNKEKTKEKITKYLHEKKIIQFGEFTLASGAKSSFYIDLRLLPSYPKIFQKINEMAAEIIKEEIEMTEVDAVVGIPMAAVPYSTILSIILEKPHYLLRKKAKDHGTKKILEGRWEKGQKILLIDDLVSSGASKKEPIEKLKELGLKVEQLFLFVYRSKTPVKELEEELGVKITYIIDLEDLKKAQLLAEGERNE
ncbi:MAG: orotate phosphoribosyltransferase [Candidatus Kariarchaeaceae archaeon]